MSLRALELPPGATVAGEIGTYEGAGGRRLAYRLVRAPRTRSSLVYLHGIESHAAWFLPAAERLTRRGSTTLLAERRGSGLNAGEAPGDAASARVLLEDVHRAREVLDPRPVALIGLSWGGKLALAAALERPRGLRALVLVTPGLVPRVDVPLGDKLRIAASCLVGGGRASIDVPIEPEMFTTEARALEYIRSDRLRLHRVTARLFLAGRALDRRIRAGIEGLCVPVLVVLAGRDRIVDNRRTLELLGRAPAELLRVRTYESATHSVQFDQTDELVADIDEFLEDQGC